MKWLIVLYHGANAGGNLARGFDVGWKTSETPSVKEWWDDVIQYMQVVNQTMKTENTTAIVVRNEEGKILLVKRGNKTFHGYWCIPGGHSEKGETPQQTAQREANEEVGNVAVESKYFLIHVHDWPADRHTSESHKHKCHIFFGKVLGELRAGDDAAELSWFTLEEAKKLKITEYTRFVLDKLK